MKKHKHVVVEPRARGGEFDAAIKLYSHSIDNGKGAVLFAVCRGKVSSAGWGRSPRFVSQRVGCKTLLGPLSFRAPLKPCPMCPSSHRKASEGIDFADAQARAVLVVGIPFPNVKDTKVGFSCIGL